MTALPGVVWGSPKWFLKNRIKLGQPGAEWKPSEDNAFAIVSPPAELHLFKPVPGLTFKAGLMVSHNRDKLSIDAMHQRKKGLALSARGDVTYKLFDGKINRFFLPTVGGYSLWHSDMFYQIGFKVDQPLLSRQWFLAVTFEFQGDNRRQPRKEQGWAFSFALKIPFGGEKWSLHPLSN